MCVKFILIFFLKLVIIVYMCGYLIEQYSLKVFLQIFILFIDKIFEDFCKYFDFEDFEGFLYIFCNNFDKDFCQIYIIFLISKYFEKVFEKNFFKIFLKIFVLFCRILKDFQENFVKDFFYDLFRIFGGFYRNK